MALLDDLAARALSENPTEGWLDETLTIAKSRTDSHATLAAIKVLEENKNDLNHLGNYGLVVAMTHLAAGNYDKATEFYLKRLASVDELIAASRKGTQDLLKAHAEAEKRKQEALAVLLKIGIFTAKYVLPVLIGML